MGPLETYSTRGLLPRQKTDFWNLKTWEAFLPCDSDLADPVAFRGAVRRRQVADLFVSEVHTDALIAHRSPWHVAQMREQLFFLHLQLEGTSVNTQGECQWVLEPRQFAMADSARPSTKNYLGTLNRSLVVAIPAAVLGQYVPHPERLVGRVVNATHGAGGLTADFLVNLWTRYSGDFDATAARRLAHILVDLLAGTYATVASSRVDADSVATVHRVRILSYIESHLHEPGLTPAHIAAACEMSARHLHHLFADADETVGQLILRRRLERAAAALADVCQRHRTVTSIALDQGFINPTHFGRAFRARHALTPLAYRRRHTGQR